MDAEPVTPDAFLGSQIPELPPELRILRIRACADCTPPARSMPAPAPASNRSARGTHPWPIRHPPRLAFRVPFAVTRSTPPPKGKAMSRSEARPFGPRHPEGQRFSSGPRFEFLAGESLDLRNAASSPLPLPAGADMGRRASPEGSTRMERPLADTTEPSSRAPRDRCLPEKRVFAKPSVAPATRRRFPAARPRHWSGHSPRRSTPKGHVHSPAVIRTALRLAASSRIRNSTIIGSRDPS